MQDQLTVIIPTSPIPSHPDTKIIDETIANIRKYTDAKIIIMCDGVHESLRHREWAYTEYLKRINLYEEVYNNIEIMPFSGHNHQAIMTRMALDYVTTPLILFAEHDCSPIGEIPFREICDLVEKKQDINYMRFNIFHKIPDEHEYLMFGQQVDVNGVRFQRTIQFSARPHIAKADWYRQILKLHFKEDQKTMIEDVMHSVVQVSYNELKSDIYGLTIYTPEGNQLRSYHSDGRGSDEKIIEA